MALLGLDIGTTGVKALVIDDAGDTLATHTDEYPLSTPRPGWVEQDPELPDAMPQYAFLLYPELTYIPDDTLQYSLRSVFSPIDLSGQITTGASWNVLQGFTLNCYLICNLGESGDTFAWSRDVDLWRVGTDYIDGVAISAGFNYIY